MKKLILLALASLFLVACSGGGGGGGSPNPNPDLFSSIGRGVSNIGGCIDSTTNLASTITLGQTTYQVDCSFGNDPAYDTEFFTELALQKRFWNGVPAAAYIFDDTPQNALAFPSRHILYGENFFHTKIVGVHGNAYQIPMSVVLAHEWGHQLEYLTGQIPRNPDFELEADALAGFYLHFQKNLSLAEIRSALGFTASLGDPPRDLHGNHGSAEQRRSAITVGIAYVNTINAGTIPQPRTWQELMDDISWLVDCLSLNKLQSEVTDFGVPRSCS